ncbi:MAG: CpsB/CapC family capsule biosynthesis tyrosine phosphatase [Desulfobulbales bacterium]|nr:CpsB/CapC family capsule biosynthesis tyrosine phosphatase [Desulfobulbales bacterium]
MIDLHCHVLPGIDDGSRLMEETLDMVRTAVRNNIDTIVATPHTLNGFFTNTWDNVTALTATVQKALAAEEIPVTLFPGMEAQVCPELFGALSQGKAATINDNARYMLLEFPPFSMPANSREFIFKLKLQGITPVIAHPERHLILQNDLQQLADLVRQGALCQLTALSITGHLGSYVQKSAEQMIRTGLAHVIATDAHANDLRIMSLAPAVDAAAEILQDYTRAEQMVTSTPAAIIAGEDIVVDEPVLDDKKWWMF